MLKSKTAFWQTKTARTEPEQIKPEYFVTHIAGRKQKMNNELMETVSSKNISTCYWRKGKLQE